MACRAAIIEDIPFLISQGGQVVMLIIVLILMIIYRK